MGAGIFLHNDINEMPEISVEDRKAWRIGTIEPEDVVEYPVEDGFVPEAGDFAFVDTCCKMIRAYNYDNIKNLNCRGYTTEVMDCTSYVCYC